MLVSIVDTIEQHFPDYEQQPVRPGEVPRGLEPRHDLGLAAEPRGRRPQPEDRLEPDAHPPLRPHDKYVGARRSKIAGRCRTAGSDRQRGGWYDVVERVRQPGEESHRFAWHDRKAWWQQEQAILAYLILAGSTGDDGVLRARRARRRRSTTPSSSTTTRASSTSTSSPTACRTCSAPSGRRAATR